MENNPDLVQLLISKKNVKVRIKIHPEIRSGNDGNSVYAKKGANP
jgi:hypothetical protein